ncbi:unnamed protein product, partial [marine sediment metagenome]
MNKEQEAQIGISGIGIPSELLFNPFITHTEKILFGYLQNLSRSKDGCWATNKYLGWLIGCGKQNISNSISSLKKYQYITINETTNKDGSKRRHIYINPNYKTLYKEIVEKIHDELYNDEYTDIKELLYRYIEDIIVIKRVRIKSKDKEINININKDSGTESDSFDNPLKENPIDNNPEPKQNKILELPKGSFARNSIRIIGKWNSFESTSTHKTNKPYTITYIKLIKDLIKLQQGTFFKNKITDEEWIKQNNIPDEILDKKWTTQELTIAINHLSKYSLEGYWPSNKNNFKSLPNLLYNPRSMKSILLYSYIIPP